MKKSRISRALMCSFLVLAVSPLVLPSSFFAVGGNELPLLVAGGFALANVDDDEDSIIEQVLNEQNRLLCDTTGMNCFDIETAICGGFCIGFLAGVAFTLFLETDLGQAIFGPVIAGMNWTFDRLGDGLVWLILNAAEGWQTAYSACLESGGQAAVSNDEVTCGYTFIMPVPFPAHP